MNKYVLTVRYFLKLIGQLYLEFFANKKPVKGKSDAINVGDGEIIKRNIEVEKNKKNIRGVIPLRRNKDKKSNKPII